jgi:ABC-type Fe3+-hydroxamate transport system substrate-binding protein
LKKKLMALISAALMLVSVLAGCGAANVDKDGQNTGGSVTSDVSDSSAHADASQAQNTPREDFSYTDSCGREVTIPGEVTRVVVSGPMTQMMVYALARKCW